MQQQYLLTLQTMNGRLHVAEKQEDRSKKQSTEAIELGKGPIRAFNRVVAYCTEPQCRRATLLAHFGEKLQNCSGCDYCDDSSWAASKVASSFCAASCNSTPIPL